MIIIILLLIIILSIQLVVGVESPSFFNDTSISIIYWTITVWYFIRYKRNSVLCFELFFAISFYLCSFLTNAILPLLDTYEARSFLVDKDLICKSYTLSLVGYLVYIFALVTGKDNNREDYCCAQFTCDANVLVFSNILCSIFVILLFATGGARMLTMYSSSDISVANRLDGFAAFVSFAVISFIVSTFINFASVPNIRNCTFVQFFHALPILFKINSFVLILLFLFSGYRSNAIQIIIPLLLCYHFYVKKITIIKVLVILVAGMFLMVIIGFVRQGSAFSPNEYNIVNYLQDFKAANSATLYLVDRADSVGPTHGGNVLFPIFSVIPGLQSLMSLFIDINSLPPVSSIFFTNEFNSVSGMGTSMIGDLYYSFGFVGVIVLMFVYGKFLRWISAGSSSYKFVMFLVFSGNAVLAPRVEFFFILRSISWAVIFLFLIKLFAKK